MVDYNLSNVRASWLKYFKIFFVNLLKTIIQIDEEYLSERYYFRAENEVSKYSSRELIEIIYLIDRNFEEKPYLKVSKDIAYYTFVRNLALKSLPKPKIAS